MAKRLGTPATDHRQRLHFRGKAIDPQSRPLIEYVKKLDASYHWTKVGGGTIGKAQYVELLLTSQTWKNIVWKHQLFIIKPDKPF